MNWPILSVVTFLPLFGAVLVMLLVRGNERLGARYRALDRAVGNACDVRDFAGDGLALRCQFGGIPVRRETIIGWALPPIIWASTAFRCPSLSSRRR